MKLPAFFLLAATLIHTTRAQNQSWPTNHGAPGNGHYSPLTQINRENVSQLSVAWTYDTRETGGLQTCPIIIDGTLYAVTPSQKVFALDAATGKELWKFDSGIPGTQPIRGIAFWSSDKSSDPNNNAGQKRILV